MTRRQFQHRWLFGMTASNGDRAARREAAAWYHLLQRRHHAGDFRQPMVKNLSEMKGARILLHAEQGFGDAMQFCRYATLVSREGATFFLECPSKLVRIFKSIEGVTEVIERGEPLPDFDLHCPLMSLPLALEMAKCQPVHFSTNGQVSRFNSGCGSAW